MADSGRDAATGGADGDVVVESAGDLAVADAEDVFVEDRAAPYGAVRVEDAHDVRLASEGTDHRSVHRDAVVDEGRAVTVRRAEDVAVKPGTVSGDLTVRGAEDVVVADVAGATVEAVEDVFVQSGAVDRDDVTVSDAEDVFLRRGAVAGDVTVAGAEHVLLAPGAVDGRVAEGEGGSYHAASGEVRVEAVEDVLVEAGAVEGDLTVEDADAVREDVDLPDRR